MKVRSVLLVLLLIGMGSACFASTKACQPHYKAPSTFENPPKWGTDAGPLLPGFVDLDSGTGGSDVLHGVDLSENNVGYIVYEQLQYCGAAFALVRLDKQYESHVTALSLQNIAAIPYYDLTVVDQSGHLYKKAPEVFSHKDGSELTADELNHLIQIAHVAGAERATIFINRFGKQIRANQEKIRQVLGFTEGVIAVDVEDALAGKSTRMQRQEYGRFYAAFLASWISAVQGGQAGIKVILYTYPDMFVSYLENALPADNAVIHGLPIWLSSVSSADGADIPLDRKDVSRICLSTSGGNRCILHQYTHRGMFAVTQPKIIKAVSHPNHIDVDRFFPVSLVEDSTGSQYVRRTLSY